MSGIFAALVWAMMPVVILNLARIPPLEILSFALVIGFFSSIIIFYLTNFTLSLSSFDLKHTVLGTIAISGTACLYISAFKYSPPVHVEIIMYVWPIIVILTNIFLGRDHLTFKKILVIILCFCALLSIHLENLFSINMREFYYFGYTLTFLAAISWAFYNIFTKNCDNPSQLMGFYAGIGAPFILGLHFIFEISVFPTLQEFLYLSVIGVLSKSLAYQAWDFAVKNSSPIVMTNIAYFIPITSVIMLVMFGYAELTTHILISCFLLFSATALILPSKARS